MGQAEHLKATELYDLDRLTIQRQVICHGKLYELVGGNENCHDNKRNYKHLFPTPFMNSKALRKTEPLN